MTENDLTVGQVITFGSADNTWSRKLEVVAIDGDNVTYRPVVEDD